MGLAGLRFLDSPRSGSLRFLEPKPSGLQVLLRKLLTQNTNPYKKKKKRPEKTCDNSGYPEQTRFAE